MENTGTSIIKVDEKVQAQLTVRNIDDTAWKVLKETIYPDAKDESILMALDYCKARNLDPLKKCVHIVPIWNSDKNKMVDTIWQGIAEIRTTAMRTREYAGIDETKFGEMVSKKLGTKDLTFPEWAQVTVYRLIAGQRVPFTGDKVYFEETYATLKDKKTPNSMWASRPKGQLCKCTEANALRKAFPEELGSDYIAEEMQHMSNEPAPRGETIAVETEKAQDLKAKLKADKEQVIDAEYTKEPEPQPEPPVQEPEQPVQAEDGVCVVCSKTLSANELKYSKTHCYKCQQNS